jgi:toxin YhaV
MILNGWTLLSHGEINNQLRKLASEYERARKSDPEGFSSNANVKVFAALGKLMLETIPEDPTRPEYRQGNTLGNSNRHWFRAKFFQRFRLFFRYDSRHRIIVYAWVNDSNTLRKEGAKSDAYAVFAGMLESGNPPKDWDALVKSCVPLPRELALPSAEVPEKTSPIHSEKQRKGRK